MPKSAAPNAIWHSRRMIWPFYIVLFVVFSASTIPIVRSVKQLLSKEATKRAMRLAQEAAVTFSPESEPPADDVEPTVESTVEPTVESTVEPTVRFDLESSVKIGDDSTEYVGWVTNDSPFDVASVSVAVVLLDANAAKLDSQRGSIGANRVGAGERVAYSIRVTNAPIFASVRFEAEARRATTDALLTVAGLTAKLTSSKSRRLGAGFSTGFHGTVHHGGTEAAEHSRVEVTAFDAKGRLIGAKWVPIHLSVLWPGRTRDFSYAILWTAVKPARLEVSVSGRPKRH